MNLGMIILNQDMGKNARLCYMDTDSDEKKTIDIYVDIVKDVKARFDRLNYELERQLLKGKNKKVIGLMKDELDRKTMKRFAALRTKTYSYLTDNNNKVKNQKTQKIVSSKNLQIWRSWKLFRSN